MEKTTTRGGGAKNLSVNMWLSGVQAPDDASGSIPPLAHSLWFGVVSMNEYPSARKKKSKGLMGAKLFCFALVINCHSIL